MQITDYDTPVTATDKPMSLTAYGKRRGVSAMTISRAVKDGRLSECVVRDAAGRPIGISDPELADREFEANTDRSTSPQRAKPGTAVRDYNDEAAKWKSGLAELKFKREAEELVPAADVRGEWQDIISGIRTKLLGLPSRAKQALPDLGVTEVGTLENLVREILEEVADDR